MTRLAAQLSGVTTEPQPQARSSHLALAASTLRQLELWGLKIPTRR
jgi:hypothetical protein